MKKIILILSVVFLCSFCITTTTSVNEQNATVWVCPNGTTYHKSPSCIEVKKCSGTAQKSTLSTAQRNGKTACGICYPKRTTPSTRTQATKTKKTTTNTSSNGNQATKTQKSTTNTSQSQATKTPKTNASQATKTKK